MLLCCCCQSWVRGPICGRCATGLVVDGSTEGASGVLFTAAYSHEATARRLVHLLKYQGVVAAGSVLATAMVPLLPEETAALVPVPRAMLRKAKYGTDPALVLARLIGGRTGIPVTRALAAQLWWPAHAGTSRSRRRAPRFSLIRDVSPGSVLIDDVLTTGATIAAASRVTGLRRALTATRAGV